MLTKKQKHILRVIIDAFKNNAPVSMDELLGSLPYKTTKQSMQFSIRALVARELITKGDGFALRDGRWRVVYLPTDQALELV